ncbi:hypothetical protein TNCV_998151 [Trichonephila clavipes]|nr:hypothetical protein TNCV_998151 [Trichonephila clavipes]
MDDGLENETVEIRRIVSELEISCRDASKCDRRGDVLDRRVGQRCTLNRSRAETSSRWYGMVVRRGGASSGVVHVT